MITCILNDRIIAADAPPMMPLLDYLRNIQGLHATKTGCREGDCGACTVLVGRQEQGHLRYRSVVSCLMPLGNAAGAHILTVEGLQGSRFSPVQESIVRQNAVQCGFCTPGIVMALTGLCLSEADITPERAIRALDGNLCRCTGYASLKKTALELAAALPPQAVNRPLAWLVQHGYLPPYMENIPQWLEQLNAFEKAEQADAPTLIAGGTDLMTRHADALRLSPAHFLLHKKELSHITIHGNTCSIGSSATMTDILQHTALQAHFPDLEQWGSLIASTPIRNMGTLGGNLVNASPIADMAILLLALEADILLDGPHGARQMPLHAFFQGYKKTALLPEEYVVAVRFQFPEPGAFVHFEKVSKRRHLDIASVNSCIKLNTDGEKILSVSLSAGGVSPVPLLLARTCAFLAGKTVEARTLTEANRILQAEIRPIDDIRGSAAYKRLLLRQLFFAHFLKRFPDRLSLSALLRQNPDYEPDRQL